MKKILLERICNAQHRTLRGYLTAMFIAHAPAGYILAVSLLGRFRDASVPSAALILACMAGAVAPDFDLAYFYLIDGRMTPHHKYLTHWPIVWLVLVGASAIWLRYVRSPIAGLVLAFGLGGMLHLVLDSFAGKIWWFEPFVDQPYSLVTVPAAFRPWWLNFVLHWSFLTELAICSWAFNIYRLRARRSLVERQRSFAGTLTNGEAGEQ